MVVAGLQRVPEEHDVRSEVQTLQVLVRGKRAPVPCNSLLLQGLEGSP